MCVATAIVVGVGAAGAISAAKMGSNAAKTAAKSQKDAGDQAIAFQREQYEQSQKDFQPYAAGGAAAMGRLSGGAGTPVQGFRQAAPPPQLGMPAAGPTPAGQSGPGSVGEMAPPQMAAGAGLAGAGASMAALPGRGARPMPAGAPQLGAATQAPVWTIRAPDGQTRQFPAAVAQQYIAHGAERVA